MTFSLHAPSRRELMLGAGVLFSWAYLPKLARAEGRDPRMLVIVLRGALDGLATVAPVGDPDWVKLRGERALELLRHRSVGPGHDAVEELRDEHLGAEPAPHRAQLEPDRAAADHEQAAGDLRQRERFGRADDALAVEGQ